MNTNQPINCITLTKNQWVNTISLKLLQKEGFDVIKNQKNNLFIK